MKSKKSLVIIIISIAVIAVYIAGYATNSGFEARFFGTKEQVSSQKKEDIVATIDGEKITQNGFDSYKNGLNTGRQTKLTDKQVLDKIIERQVIYDEAVKEGFSVTDEEVDKEINTSRDALTRNPEEYKSMKAYIISLNMTEDEYWKIQKPVYKKGLIIGKYKTAEKQKYMKDVMSKATSEVDKNFDEYFNKYFNKKVKELISKAKIQIFIK
ncbi:MAG TPA: SurA N-terminal domain-containing protein [Ruminiclostridium sp.]|nr:SurA N-terminal domain-containing protein [Ruminiclostridium sp.]